MYYMPLHIIRLQFPQLFEDFAVKMFKAIKCKNVLASQDRWKIWGWLGFVPTNFTGFTEYFLEILENFVP